MSRLTDALRELLGKCTDGNHEPAGDKADDILECLAEHFSAGGGGGKLYKHHVKARFNSMSWDVGMGAAFSGHALFVVEFDVYSTKSAKFSAIEEVLKIGETVHCTGYTGNDDSSGYDNYDILTICGMDVNGFWVGCYQTYSSGMSAPELMDWYASDMTAVTITDTVTEV